MNENLKELEKLVKEKLEIVDFYRYTFSSKESVGIIKEYFSKHQNIEVKIEYNHPNSLEDFGNQYTAIFSKKEEIKDD